MSEQSAAAVQAHPSPQELSRPIIEQEALKRVAKELGEARMNLHVQSARAEFAEGQVAALMQRLADAEAPKDPPAAP